MTKREEQAVLREAAEIIIAAVRSGQEVRIPSFGKFYLGTVTCRENVPAALGGKPTDDDQEFLQTVPRFRAFRRFKSVVRQRSYLT